MSEDIKKNAEISDDELEQVSGGNAYLEERAPNCPICEVKMRLTASWVYYRYFCDTCGRTIDVEL